MIYWGLGVSVWVLGARVGLGEVDLERLLLECFEGVWIRIDGGRKSLGRIAYVSLLLQVRRKDSMFHSGAEAAIMDFPVGDARADTAVVTAARSIWSCMERLWRYLASE